MTKIRDEIVLEVETCTSVWIVRITTLLIQITNEMLATSSTPVTLNRTLQVTLCAHHIKMCQTTKGIGGGEVGLECVNMCHKLQL